MKMLIIVSLAVFVGAVGHHFLTDKPTQEVVEVQAQDVIDQGWTAFQIKYYEKCRTRLLNKTHCFQKRSAEDCVRLIEKKCGDAHPESLD